MLAARKRGFEIVLIYIGTEDVEINLTRIRNRVLAGGHDVPEEDVRRRYKRSFANLPTAIDYLNTLATQAKAVKEAFKGTSSGVSGTAKAASGGGTSASKPTK